MEQPRRRLFAGARVRDLRKRLALPQAALAARLGVSVSYLSQIENEERPLTPPVLIALTREFPQLWGEVGEDEATADLVRAIEAGTDSSIPGGALDEAAVQRGVEKHPALTRRMVALHDAWRRGQAQLRVLDDKVESGAGTAGSLPWEEVRDWYQAEGNYIDVLDRAAEALAETFDHPRAIEDRLRDTHSVRIEDSRDDDTRLSRFATDSRRLTISGVLPPESRAFLLAHRLAVIEFGEQMRAVSQTSGLASPAARELLSLGLANYAAGALLMPYTRFREAAREVRHDIDRLRQRFGSSFEQACHRLSTLQRPGAQGIPFFFCRVDMAGNITKRHSATRLEFARFGGACPLWVVHEAVAIPDRILVQLAETPDGVRYVAMAKGLVKPSASYARPPRRYAVALGCEEAHAADFVYADSLRTGGVATAIGTSCRICPRTDCDQRAFPPAASEIRIDPDVRAPVPYAF
ncbi:short-chain fatty acyl-CoA regulator family protein [Sphingomonas sp. BT-65]|uniref:short-chain fatty acyl-CoA regulator family protein n=1 Tax=Sphingomonas sp. BT-65 TaxID=2989821 RepID=UPI002236458A|nr:short-chain fatty acyl-CoA regulator family protein [Sphingomonas sp. BT-65]MCW4460143.1 short-chain fatty acyl-CoA regulator family protein [Sphingomonas sp. BT-65]